MNKLSLDIFLCRCIRQRHAQYPHDERRIKVIDYGKMTKMWNAIAQAGRVYRAKEWNNFDNYIQNFNHQVLS